MSVALRDYPLLLLIVAAPLLYGMVEIGFQFGQRGRRTNEKFHEQYAATRDQAGLLLSLLLGFTLSMALSRYDLRKQQIVEEANAIGTARLRVALLREETRPKATQLFRDYVDIRIAFSRAGADQAALDRVTADSGVVQAELWALAAEGAKKDPSPTTALFVASLNESFDACDRRLAGVENRIPREVWMMLGMLALTTAILSGLSLFKRSVFAMVVVPLMLAVVMQLIAELDTPGTGMVRTEARSIERLRTE
jgi:hypothetical protein